MKLKSNPKTFFTTLVLITLVSYVVQKQMMNSTGFTVLETSYIINAAFAGIIYGALYKWRQKHQEKLGFIFMAGSGLKFLAFFIFLYPWFKEDGEMTRIEFITFFVPYAITTALETFFLVRALNEVE